MSEALASPATEERALLRSGSHLLTAAYALIGLLNFGYAIALTHVLSAGDYAAFAAAQALLLVVGTLAGSSVPWVLAHRLATDDSGDRRQRTATISFGFVVNAAAGSVAAVVVVLIAWRFLDGSALVAAALATFLLFVATTPVGWLQGRGRFAELATLRVVEVIVKIAVGVAAGAAGGGVAGAVLGFAVGASAVLLIGCWRMRADLSIQRPNLRLAGALRMTLGMTAIQGLVATITSVDVVLVALLPVPAEQAATYQAAAVLAKTPLFVASGIAAAVFPLLSASRDAPALASAALKLYAFLTVPVVAVSMTVPGAVLGLVLPDEYEGVTSVLRLLTLAGAGLGLLVLDATLLQSQQRYRAALRRMLPGVVVLVVAVVLGWQLVGLLGMAGGACVGVLVNAASLRRARGGGSEGDMSTFGLSGVVGAGLVLLLVVVRSEPLVWFLLAAAAGAGGLTLFLLKPETRPSGATRMSRGEEDGGTVSTEAMPPLSSDDGHPARGPADAAPEGLHGAPQGAAGPVVRVRSTDRGDTEILEMPRARYVVVSPHLDDAVLSCGGLLLSLRGRHDVTVVTLFTEGHGPSTLSARAFLKQCRVSDLEELYASRRKEDARVMDDLGVRWTHLGLVDALFRKRAAFPPDRRGPWRVLPEVGHVYPTFRLHVASGRVSRHDGQLVRQVVETITELAQGEPTVVLAPLGVGRHVDHVLARDAAARTGAPVIYYADVPYVLQADPDPAFVERQGLVRTVLPPGATAGADAAAKRRLIAGYTSQHPALFPDGIPDLPDILYVPHSMLQRR